VLVEALTGTGGLAVMALGAVLVAHGALAPRTLPLLTLLALASFVPVSEIARISKELADALASVQRIFAVEDEPVLLEDGPAVAVPLSSDGTATPLLQYDTVSFT
jgi:ATP-binding cassette subfamily B protein